MASNDPVSIRLEFTSAIEMVDLVEVVGDHISRGIGLDDDAVHWVRVSIRECVVNAIRHGNQLDASKRVFVEFRSTAGPVPEMSILVRDQGDGFDPENLADPLAPENLLKGSGRGIFLIRTFMDDVQLRRVPEGGMEVSMVKRSHPAATPDGSVAT